MAVTIHPSRTGSEAQESMRRIVFILAGGGSRRMGGCDKAIVKLHGVRLIDRVIEQMTPQADQVLISAARSYDTGIECVPDLAGAPRGPVGGLRSICEWMAANEPDMTGFFTAPVDGPFAPPDLVQRLGESGETTIASDGEEDHPTFAFWAIEALSAAFPKLTESRSVSLKKMAEMCAARRVVWQEASVFLNVNTPEDLRAVGSFD